MSGRRNRPPEPWRDLPLIAWGEGLRARKARVRRLWRRAALVGSGVLLLLGSAAFPPAPYLVWNASRSAPTGLYAVRPGAPVDVGDMAVAWPPQRYRGLAATRRYVPLGVPLVKRAAAVAGDEVCAIGPAVFVNGRPAARRRATDPAGRAMPAWHGCRTLRGRQLLLLMDDPASFDGRYFGPTEGRDVVGRARLLWRR